MKQLELIHKKLSDYKTSFLLANLAACFLIFGSLNVGFDNELGVDLTNAWMFSKGYFPYIDYFDIRASFFPHILFGSLFKWFGPSYFLYRFVWYLGVILFFNVLFWFMAKRTSVFFALFVTLISFSYNFGAISSNPSHMIHPFLGIIAISTLNLFRSSSHYNLFLGFLVAIGYLFEVGGLSNSVHLMLSSVVPVLIFRDKKSIAKAAQSFFMIQIGLIITLLMFGLFLWLGGVSPLELLLNLKMRFTQMSKTAVVMDSGSLWNPISLFNRHYDHWLGSFIYYLKNYGFFSLVFIKHVLNNLIYFWIGMAGVFYGLYKFMILFFKGTETSFINKALFLSWAYLTANWSIELVRGAPFLNHTPQYTFIFTVIFWSLIIWQSHNKFSKPMKYMSLVLLSFFCIFVFFKSPVKNLKHALFNPDFQFGKSRVLQGMRMNNGERHFYDNVCHTIDRDKLVSKDSKAFVLGYDTNFYFFCDLEIEHQKIVNLVMFQQAPIPNFDATNRIEQLLSNPKVRVLIVPYYSEHPHSIKDEESSKQTSEGLAGVVLRIMNENSKRIFDEEFELYKGFTNKEDLNYNDTHSHIYVRKGPL